MRIKYRIGQLYLEMQEHSEAQEIFNSHGQNRTQEFIIGLAEANLEVAQVLFSHWSVKIHDFIGHLELRIGLVTRIILSTYRKSASTLPGGISNGIQQPITINLETHIGQFDDHKTF